MAWRGSRLGFVAETRRFFAFEMPSAGFSCLYTFVPCFLLFVFRFAFISYFFPASRYVYLLRVTSSVQQPSVALSKLVLYSTCSFWLCHLYPTPTLLQLSCFSFVNFFFVALIFPVTFIFLFCYSIRYASIWFSYLESFAFAFSLSHCLWPQSFYLSRMNDQERHWGYGWCRWVERTVEWEDNNINMHRGARGG